MGNLCNLMTTVGVLCRCLQTYADHFKDNNGRVYVSHQGYPPPKGAPVLVPTTPSIEKDRPKSPLRR